MESTIGHIYLYVSDLARSHSFYKKILIPLGYSELLNEDWGYAFINNGTSLFFEQAPEDHVQEGYHRRRIGLNHIAFKVDSREAVDTFFKDVIVSNKFKVLYDTPKAFPEYGQHYYAVFFEDPDGIKLEVAYYAE
ncbi:MAG TPA: VOC family protein [bacterium]|nr:VOC family protein [bacterium]